MKRQIAVEASESEAASSADEHVWEHAIEREGVVGGYEPYKPRAH
jgi:hypothetical protein